MLFIHDHTFVNKNNELYTTGSLNQAVMNRYKNWFGNVTVFATTRIATDKDEVYVKNENKVENIDFVLQQKNRSIKYMLKCCALMKEEIKKADCIVSRMSIFGAIGVYYSRKYNKPYIVEMVACPWDSLWYHSLKGKLIAPFMTLLTKHICKRAPYVLYVTNEFLQKRYPTNGINIGCSDVELTNIDSNVLDTRLTKIKNYDLENTKYKMCTLANIAVKYKGQDIVINSINKLKELGIECEYYLIGGGNPDRLQKVIVENKLEDCVHIIGPVPHEQVFSYVDDVDLYIQPSKQEGLPRAVIEAMSRGCPVIGANTGGIPELINDDMVFKKGSETDFIRVMKSLTKDKLVRCANENQKMSNNYEKMYLDKKRSDFYMNFAKSIMK